MAVSAVEDPFMLQIKINFEKLNFKCKDNLNEFHVEYWSKFVKSIPFALVPMEELTNFRLASKVSMISWTFYCLFEVLFWADCLVHLVTRPLTDPTEEPPSLTLVPEKENILLLINWNRPNIQCFFASYVLEITWSFLLFSCHILPY